MARRLSHIGGRRKAEGQLLKARRCTGGGSKEVFSFVSSRRPQILEKEKALGAKATEAPVRALTIQSYRQSAR